MKRILLIVGMLLLPASVFAIDSVWKSSATATADAARTLCGQGLRGYFHGVCVNTTAGASVTDIYDSSWTVTGTKLLGSLSNGTQGCRYYDTVTSKGLLYNKTGVADVTILYDCY